MSKSGRRPAAAAKGAAELPIRGAEPPSEPPPVPDGLVACRVVGNVWGHEVGDLLRLLPRDVPELVRVGAVEIVER